MSNLIGRVGVDAGLMYIGDPCYFIGRPLGSTGVWTPERTREADEAWDRFYKNYIGEDERRDFYVIERGLGMVVRTGWGDGSYPVEVTMKQGRVASVKVTFMGLKAQR